MLGRRIKRRELLIEISPRHNRNNRNPTCLIKKQNKQRYVLKLAVTLIVGLCFVITGITEAKTITPSLASDGSVQVMNLPKPDLTSDSLPKSETMAAQAIPSKAESVNTPTAPPTPEPSATPAVPQKPVLPQGTLLVINKTEFTLSLYKDGQKEETYSAGLGKHSPKTETPVGKFEVISRTVDPPLKQDTSSEVIPGGDPKNPLGPRWMGLNIGISKPDSIGIHGTTEGAGVGRPQTDGCVQLNNTVIRTLYDQVPLGTPVWIGTTDQLADCGI